MAEHTFSGGLYLWKQRVDSWVFVNLPEALTDEIDALLLGRRKAFGAVKVEVRVGATTWRTSIFASKEHGTYMLPVKRAVLRSEGLVPGDPVTVHLTVLDTEA